ncbi:MAG: imelysin family protein, partial [Planctomycetota bacterium]
MVHPFATQERVLALLLLASLAPAQDVAREIHVDPVVRGYADLCYTTYTAAGDGAAKLEAAVRAFAERPERATLDAARKAWIAARVAYSRTETFRFCGGPIDDVEPLLNAWPVDEVYIDCVPGLAATGIVHDVAHFPRINEHVLTYANERGGETNVSVGWHAIEFFLWGQDQDPNGPGDRSPDDFVDGKKPHADRRRQY